MKHHEQISGNNWRRRHLHPDTLTFLKTPLPCWFWLGLFAFWTITLWVSILTSLTLNSAHCQLSFQLQCRFPLSNLWKSVVNRLRDIITVTLPVVVCHRNKIRSYFNAWTVWSWEYEQWDKCVTSQLYSTDWTWTKGKPSEKSIQTSITSLINALLMEIASELMQESTNFILSKDLFTKATEPSSLLYQLRCSTPMDPTIPHLSAGQKDIKTFIPELCMLLILVHKLPFIWFFCIFHNDFYNSVS